ncbi:MAG TPA: DUF4336 domain-containing protein [Candidatus Obscuribacterales bacterium]
MLFLHEVAPDLWTATQSWRFLGVEVGSRMTVVRLPSQDLVLISPIALTRGDRALLAALGPVQHLIAPNRFHHVHLQAAQALYPHAKVWGAPGLEHKRPDLHFDRLLHQAGHFEGTLSYLPVAGFGALLPTGIHLAHETVFCHQPSGTLILTDLAYNFDDSFPWVTQLAARVLGSYQTLRPSRSEKWGTWDKATVEAAIRQVLAWEFDRVIPAHGTIVETHGKRQLRAGYEWFLGRSLAAE